MRRVLEGLCARRGELSVIGLVHVDAENGDGIEAPVPVCKALRPSVRRPLWGFDDRHGAVVVV